MRCPDPDCTECARFGCCPRSTPAKVSVGLTKQFPSAWYRLGLEKTVDRARLDRLFGAIAWAALVLREREEHTADLRDAVKELRADYAEALAEALYNDHINQ